MMFKFFAAFLLVLLVPVFGSVESHGEISPQQAGQSLREKLKEKRAEKRKKETADSANKTTPAPGQKTPPRFPVAPNVELNEVRFLADRALQLYDSMVLQAKHYGPWVVVHGLLGVGESLRVQDSDFGPDAIPALEWFAGGARFRNLPAFVVTKNGARGFSFTEELGIEAGALEGHPNQFIGYLSELGVPLSTPWKAWDNQKKQWSEKTLQAVLDDAKSQTGINPTPGYLLEHTWTLWALANYGAWNDQWKNERGETWNMEKLIQFEVSQGITDDTSCGGHHRIYAIYRALKQYLTQNGKLPSSGVYRNAQNFISTHLNRAEKWQNQDGSFSANNYLSASMATDWDSRLAADGHTLEVLVGILPDARLKEEWLLRAVYIVASDLTETKSHILRSPGSSWGATFHALHALRQFMERTR